LIQLQAENADGKLFGGRDYCQVACQLPGDPNMVRVPPRRLAGQPGAQVAVLGQRPQMEFKYRPNSAGILV